MNVVCSDSTTAGPDAGKDESLACILEPSNGSDTTQVFVFETPPRASQSVGVNQTDIPRATTGERNLPSGGPSTVAGISNNRICIRELDSPEMEGISSRRTIAAPSGPTPVSPSFLEVSSIRLKPRPRKRRDMDCMTARKSFSNPFLQMDDDSPQSGCEKQLLFSSFLRAITNENDLAEGSPTVVPPGENALHEQVATPRTPLALTRPRAIRRELKRSIDEAEGSPIRTMTGKLSTSFSSAFAGKL
jgi:hypothetical protein